MTPAEFAAFGKARHGDRWIKPLAQELGFHFTTIWRIARGKREVSREIEQAARLLPKKPRRKPPTTNPGASQ